jgi:hypothetical protein
MLLIIFLGLIAKITLVCCQCDIGKQDVKDFDFNKVCVRLLTGFLKEAADETLFCFY